jgi:plastocyanin
MSAILAIRPRPVIGLAATLVIIAGGLALIPPPVVRAESHAVAIIDFAFEPATVTVFVGEPVTWTNNSGHNHTVTSDEGSELDSGTIGPGEAYGHVFESPGAYTYHCDFHPDRMTATVVVHPAPATSNPSGSPEPTPPSGTLPPNFNATPSAGAPSAPPSPTPTSASEQTDDAAMPPIVIAIVILGIGAIAAVIVLRRQRT